MIIKLQIKEQFVFGVFTSLEAIPLGYVEVSPTFNLDNIEVITKNDEAVDIAELITLSSISLQSGRQRVADVVVDAVEKGYI